MKKIWNWGVRTWIPWAIPGVIVAALAKAGALLQNNIFIYIMIIGICLITLLVVFNKLKEPYYPHLIGAIGLGLLFQSTLLSPGLIGSDIHTEYYYYHLALDGWDTSIPYTYNSAIGSTVIAPFLTNVFHIPGYFIFKVIYPLMFAIVPFLLYFIFKKEFGSKIAFLSSLFFVIVPTWSMEMIGIPKQMLGELMFVLCLFLILVSNWRLRIRLPLLAILGTLGAMFHYVIGPIIILYFGVSCILLLFSKRRVFPLRWLSLIVVLLLVSNIIYFSSVCQGNPLRSITNISSGQIAKVLPWLSDTPDLVENAKDVELPAVITESGAVITESELVITEPDALEPDEPGLFENQSPLIRSAIGLDFMDANIWGKTFRVFQYLTQVCIVVGCVCLVRQRKKYSIEYLSLCATSIILLGACIFIPRFSTIINATRFYHISLILLAPTFILGGRFIFRNFKLLTICLIIPYFLFTSGLVFEATQQTDISTVNMPYSISLSYRRVDVVGVSTINDIAVRDWAVDHNLGNIYADLPNSLLFSEKVEKVWNVNWRYFRLVLSTGEYEPGKCIFLSERNNETETLVFKPPAVRGASVGMRVAYPYKEVGLDELIARCEIIYQQGNACILEVK